MVWIGQGVGLEDLQRSHPALLFYDSVTQEQEARMPETILSGEGSV